MKHSADAEDNYPTRGQKTSEFDKVSNLPSQETPRTPGLTEQKPKDKAMRQQDTKGSCWRTGKGTLGVRGDTERRPGD